MERNYEERELCIGTPGNCLMGRVFVPETDEPAPLAIFCHGFGANMYHLEAYARKVATMGVAGCVFDFRGGGVVIESDGEMTDMSVMTEADDLEEVMDELSSWPEIDGSRIGLAGASQGGAVIAVAAARNTQRVKRLLHFYPGLHLAQVYHERFGSKENVPETFDHFPEIAVSSRYALDMWDYDFDEAMRSFPGPVLLIQGTEDTLVPPSVSEHAQQTYPDARLVMVEGAGHSFVGRRKEIMPLVEEFFGEGLKG